MNLFSIEFVIFLSVTIVLYYLTYLVNKLTNKRIFPQWAILLIASLVFYGFVNYVYLIFLGVSFFISYIIAILCQYKLFKKVEDSNEIEYDFVPTYVSEHNRRKTYENILTAIAVIINVGILLVLKYYNFFVTSVNSIIHVGISTHNFIIPLGISFYTFSVVSYNVDCCKRVSKAELNPFKYLLYVSYFPKVLQGPISTYDKLSEDGLFNQHSFKDNTYLTSIFRISIGLLKKIVIADVIGLYVDASYLNLENVYGLSLMLTLLLYSIQLYCDFSGFLDIAIGVSGLFGIKLEGNFETPYMSSSIQLFWRRWHITLGEWLKKYIYIPLGGNRVPKWRWVINTTIVWLVSGLWHGANWTFVVWGLYHAVLLIISGLVNKKVKKKDSASTTKNNTSATIIGPLKILLTFILVSIGWMFFRSSNIKESFVFFSHMIRLFKGSAYNAFSDSSLIKANWLFAISLCLVGALIVIRLLKYHEAILSSKIRNYSTIKTVIMFAVTVAFISFSIFSFIYLKSVNGGESSFIYFDF